MYIHTYLYNCLYIYIFFVSGSLGKFYYYYETCLKQGDRKGRVVK